MSKANLLDRRRVVASLLADRKGAIAVGGLGAATYDIAATIAAKHPNNLTIVVLDNESYGETGGQTSHTAAAVDLVGVARACGISDSRSLATLGEIESFAKGLQDVGSGPRFANVLGSRRPRPRFG